MLFPLPVLAVDPRAVEQGEEDVFFGAHALQDQADSIQGRQQEEDEREEEAAVVGLPHTAVYPGVASTEEGPTDVEAHADRQNMAQRPLG